MVWTCAGEHCDSVLRVALDLEVSGKRKQGDRRKPGKSVRGERDWFEGGCFETRIVERLSARKCRRNGVNPAISAKGITPEKTE